MIIRPHRQKNYVALPNSLFSDRRLSADTRAMLALLLSKARNWQLRPRPLMKELSREGEIGFGWTRLQRMLDEAMAAGYIARPMKQGHEKDGRWGKYEYIVGMPDDVLRAVQKSGVAFAPQSRDPHEGLPHAQNDFTNHKEQSPPTNIIKNDHHLPVLPPLLGAIPKRQSSNATRPIERRPGKEIVQNQIALRIGGGDPGKGWLMLQKMPAGRLDELTTRQRLGLLTDLELSDAIASLRLSERKGRPT
jgi:hypothetical protein